MKKAELIRLKMYIEDLNNKVGLNDNTIKDVNQKIQEAYNLATD